MGYAFANNYFYSAQFLNYLPLICKKKRFLGDFLHAFWNCLMKLCSYMGWVNELYMTEN